MAGRKKAKSKLPQGQKTSGVPALSDLFSKEEARAALKDVLTSADAKARMSAFRTLVLSPPEGMQPAELLAGAATDADPAIRIEALEKLGEKDLPASAAVPLIELHKGTAKKQAEALMHLTKAMGRLGGDNRKLCVDVVLAHWYQLQEAGDACATFLTAHMPDLLLGREPVPVARFAAVHIDDEGVGLAFFKALADGLDANGQDGLLDLAKDMEFSRGLHWILAGLDPELVVTKDLLAEMLRYMAAAQNNEALSLVQALAGLGEPAVLGVLEHQNLTDEYKLHALELLLKEVACTAKASKKVGQFVLHILSEGSQGLRFLLLELDLLVPLTLPKSSVSQLLTEYLELAIESGSDALWAGVSYHVGAFAPEAGPAMKRAVAQAGAPDVLSKLAEIIVKFPSIKAKGMGDVLRARLGEMDIKTDVRLARALGVMGDRPLAEVLLAMGETMPLLALEELVGLLLTGTLGKGEKLKAGVALLNMSHFFEAEVSRENPLGQAALETYLLPTLIEGLALVYHSLLAKDDVRLKIGEKLFGLWQKLKGYALIWPPEAALALDRFMVKKALEDNDPKFSKEVFGAIAEGLPAEGAFGALLEAVKAGQPEALFPLIPDLLKHALGQDPYGRSHALIFLADWISAQKLLEKAPDPLMEKIVKLFQKDKAKRRPVLGKRYETWARGKVHKAYRGWLID